MRFLITILILLTSCTRSDGQLYFGRIAAGTGGGGEPTIPGQRTLLFDDFDGTSINNDWFVRRPDKQSLAISNGLLRIIGNADTVPGSGESFYNSRSTQLFITDTGYGYSSIRNYKVEIKFKINKINDTTVGVYCGVNSPDFLDSRASSWLHLDYSSAVDTITFLGNDDTAYSYQPQPRHAFSFDFNTSDWYKMIFEVNETDRIATVINMSNQDTLEFSNPYTIGVWPLRPNYFHFGFGVMGRTDVSFDYIKVTSTELLNPDIMFIGNSITTGFSCVKIDSCYPYILRQFTNKSIRVWAGGGMGVESMQRTFNRLIEMNPEYIFIMLGTNDQFSEYNRNLYIYFVSALESLGIITYKLHVPNGGDPSSGSGWNKWISETYPSTVIDTWTTGWNTMSIGNGDMNDTLHPTEQGMRKIALIIKEAMPLLFTF